MTLNAIHTPCKKCVFAEYDGKTQIGCHINYLDKYRTKDIEIVEVYDNEHEFFVLNNKKCLGYRENKWFDTLGMSESSIDEKIAQFNRENTLSYSLLIDLKLFSSVELLSLKDQLNTLSTKPTKIVIIKYDNNKEISYDQINEFFKSLNFNAQWRIQNMLDDTVSHENIVHTVVNQNKETRFLCVISKFSHDLNKLIDTTNDIVFNQLDAFSILSNGDRTCYIFSGVVYRYALFIENQDILTNSDLYTMI